MRDLVWAETVVRLCLASIDDEYSVSAKITTRLDHISRGEITSGTNWSNQWTYRACIINARCDYELEQRGLGDEWSRGCEYLHKNHVK